MDTNPNTTTETTPTSTSFAARTPRNADRKFNIYVDERRKSVGFDEDTFETTGYEAFIKIRIMNVETGWTDEFALEQPRVFLPNDIASTGIILRNISNIPAQLVAQAADFNSIKNGIQNALREADDAYETVLHKLHERYGVSRLGSS